MKIRYPSLKVIILVIALPVIALSVFILSSPAIVNSTVFKTQISSLLSKTLGRTINLNGDLFLTLGITPTLRVTNVTIDNPSDLASRKMASVGSFKISAPFFDNVIGRYRISMIEASDVQLQFATDTTGRSNWSFSELNNTSSVTKSNQSESPPSIPIVEQLIIKNLDVSLDTQIPHRHLNVEELVVKPIEDKIHSSVSASLLIDGSALNIKGEVGAINNLFSGKDLDIKVDLTQSDNHIAAEGMLKGDGAVSLGVKAVGNDFSSLGLLLRRSLPQWTDYKLSFNLFKTADKQLSLKISDLTGKLSGPTVTGSIGVDQRDGGSYQVNADLMLASHHLITDLLLRPDGTVDVNLDTFHPDLSELSAITLTHLPAIKGLMFKGKMQYSPATNKQALVRSENFILKVGSSDLHGNIAVQLSPLEVTAQLNSDVLDLASLNKSFPASDAQVSQSKTEPHIPFKLLKELNADVKISVGQLKTILGLELAKTKLTLNLKDGVLDIPQLSSEAFDGNFTASLHASHADMSLNLRGNHFKGNPIILLAGGTPLLEGIFDFSANLKSTGDSLSQVLATLKGTMSLSSEDAKFKSTSAAAISSGLMELLSPIFHQSKEPRSDCMIFEYELDKGIARAVKQVIKLGDVFIFGKGDLDLRKSTMRYNFNVNSNNPSLASLIPPFRAYGSLSNPHFVPSASGTVASVFDTAEGVFDSAQGVLAETENLILSHPGEKIVGRELCNRAFAAERNRISSRVGRVFD
jgi:uncharacterized protein involved in outer membrane biogenesis